MPEQFAAIIVDDEPTAREILTAHLAHIPTMKIIGQFKNAINALDFLKTNAVDVVFLDINMPEVSGLSLGKLVQKEVKLIFTTAHRDYAVEGFDLQAVDYLLKPISFDRLLQAVYKLTGDTLVNQPDEQKIEESPSPFVFVRADRKMIKVDFTEITYVESLSDYIKIHTATTTIVTRETISNFEAKLPPEQFLRTHRSFIIALKKIESYTNEQVIIKDKSIPISRGYKEYVLKKLSEFH